MKANSQVSFFRIYRATLLVSVLLIASIAFSVYFGSIKTKATRATTVTDLLAFSIELNKTEFIQIYYDNSSRMIHGPQGENVTLSLSLMNKSNKTITVLWGSYTSERGQRIYFGYYVANANGTQIYRYSYDHGYLGATVEKVLNPGDQIVNLYYWSQIYDDPSGLTVAPEGTYLIAGYTRHMLLTVDGQVTSTELETPALNFTIK